MPETPDFLYKYLPSGRIDVLKGLLIRFTQASSMNDTLEFRWPTTGVEEPEKLARRIKERLRPHVLAAFPKQKRDSFDEACGLAGIAEQWIEIQLNEIAKKGSLEKNHDHKDIAERAYRKLDANYGILSLSELPDEIRMWGHYADGGRGFLIEFDAKHSWFHATRNPDDGFNELTKVKYATARVAKNLLEIKDDEVLYTKCDSWAYEQEWRIVRSFNDARKKLDSKDAYGNEILLFGVPPDAIKGVILGYGARATLEGEIRSALESDPRLRHVKVKRAVQSAETGQISIVSMTARSCLI